MKKQRILASLLILAMLSAAPAYAVKDYPSQNIPVTVHVDGKYVATDVKPYISNGRTYLPLRAAAETMGASVTWDQGSSTATVTKGNTMIHCIVGNTIFSVNGVAKYSDAPPQIRDGRIMLPIRPIAEMLGGSLSWNGKTADASIDTSAPDMPVPALPNNIPTKVQLLAKKYYVQSEGTGIGSWQMNDNSGQTAFPHMLLFISQMSDSSRHGIRIFWSEDQYGRVTGVGADDYEITPYPTGFHLKDDWTPFYWDGLGIGSGYPMYNLVNFEYTGYDLIQTGLWTFYDDPNYALDEHGKWYDEYAYYVKI